MAEEKNQTKKRDCIVDLIRILACIQVIGCHINDLGVTSLDKTRILFNTVFSGNGVAIFFILTGFFLFKNKSFKILLKKVFLSIFLPTLAVIIVSELFSNWIYNHTTFSECIRNLTLDYKMIFEKLISWSPTSTTLHLWYIFSYLKIILVFPIIRLIVKNKNATKYIILLTFALMLYTDYVTFFDPTYKFIPFYPLDITFVYPLIGYVIYSQKDQIRSNKKIPLIALGILVISECIRYILRYKAFEKDINTNIFWNWNTSFACIFAICTIIIVLSFEIKNQYTNKVISFIGQRTLMIYLIHMSFTCFIQTRGISEKLFNLFGYTLETSVNMTFVQESAFILIKLILTFIVALLASTLFHLLKLLIQKQTKKIKIIFDK